MARNFVCASCGKSKPESEKRTTHRNGEDLPLCKLCWGAALQIQEMMMPESKAEEAKRRYEIKTTLGSVMKKVINFLLSVLSPLAAAPTAWAIYAGVTEQPVFPMWEPAAIVGALAVISTSIAAGVLVTDIKAYNQGMKNNTERDEFGLSTQSAWLVFAGCVVAEVTLSLLIVVIPAALNYGVLVFPMMTAAGVFSLAVRFDLQRREADRERARISKKQAASQSKPKKAKAEPAPAEPEPAKPTFSCGFAGCQAKPFATQAALNAHKRAHKPIAYAVSTIEPVTKDMVK